MPSPVSSSASSIAATALSASPRPSQAPLVTHRPGGTGPVALPPGARIDKMNDQHAYLRLPGEADMRVGDLVGCGISHPCTTFDKWPVLLLVDDDYNVQRAINTLF